MSCASGRASCCASFEPGETIEVTDRGRPVALLSPLPGGGALERRRASGDVEPVARALHDLPEPVLAAAGPELPSGRLARLRRDEH